ncbi:MAG: peptide-methionine (S)-S-oxide reductase [Deltaproteobacteria bacterium]|nr:peptide-methionine (S)-S-oxide reductase [Deltaproteobacteria bacterium]
MRTRVGYAGGTTPSPTYHDLADHTEAFQLDFDPRQISYDALLGLFWGSHRPSRGSVSRQYMPAVFAGSRAQFEDALVSRGTLASAGVLVETPVVNGARFHLAEDYHQKYHLRHDATLMAELEAYEPHAFVDSTVAARLNGYIAGHGTLAQLEGELDSFGLSAAGAAYLVSKVQQRRAR